MEALTDMFLMFQVLKSRDVWVVVISINPFSCSFLGFRVSPLEYDHRSRKKLQDNGVHGIRQVYPDIQSRLKVLGKFGSDVAFLL